MACYHPLKGYYGRKINPETGKTPVVFNSRDGYYDRPVGLPCGRCIGCRLERSRQWATRCVHEASLHSQNSFITLTFQNSCQIAVSTARGRYKRLDYKIDPTEKLHKRHFKDFMKRLRKHFYGNTKSQIRYMHCGEYGEKYGRPHHHAILFGIEFADKVRIYPHGRKKDSPPLYTSPLLEKLWPHGSNSVGEVTFESAAYIARYTVKKFNGVTGDALYEAMKNEKEQKAPEYLTMSRRPGLATNWIKKYSDDVYPKDFIVIRGKKSKVPKFYDKCYELTNPKEYGTTKASRTMNARGNPNYSYDRMVAGEIIKKAQMANLPKTLA
ncbi:MAG: replication initiator protein [Arizlama microvirus]|nr:MAG: replication initiator protein [Arizlama microvirus]